MCFADMKTTKTADDNQKTYDELQSERERIAKELANLDKALAEQAKPKFRAALSDALKAYRLLMPEAQAEVLNETSTKEALSLWGVNGKATRKARKTQTNTGDVTEEEKKKALAFIEASGDKGRNNGEIEEHLNRSGVTVTKILNEFLANDLVDNLKKQRGGVPNCWVSIKKA